MVDLFERATVIADLLVYIVNCAHREGWDDDLAETASEALGEHIALMADVHEALEVANEALEEANAQIELAAA
jgi:hypothetical protein